MVEQEKSASVEAMCSKCSAGQKTKSSGCLQVPCGFTERDE